MDVHPAKDQEITEAAQSDAVLGDLIRCFGGTSFNQGIYRIVGAGDVGIWQERTAVAFPHFSKRVTVFGFDWLGRAFALNPERDINGHPGVVMLEPGTGDVLEIPCNIQSFHNDELINFRDAALAGPFFDDWLAAGGVQPKYNQCIGYKIPLFLGGEDGVENLQVSDIDVYWHLGQLIAQVRGYSSCPPFYSLLTALILPFGHSPIERYPV